MAFYFCYDKEILKKLHGALSKGNEWAHDRSMIIAVLSQKELDCVMKDGRVYYQFDSGLATGLLMLRATELGLVTHAIAGYDPVKVREVLSIPENMEVITLIITGKQLQTLVS